MNQLHLKKCDPCLSNYYRAEGLCIGLEIRRDNAI